MQIVGANDAVVTVTTIHEIRGEDGFFITFILIAIHIIHLKPERLATAACFNSLYGPIFRSTMLKHVEASQTHSGHFSWRWHLKTVAWKGKEQHITWSCLPDNLLQPRKRKGSASHTSAVNRTSRGFFLHVTSSYIIKKITWTYMKHVMKLDLDIHLLHTLLHFERDTPLISFASFTANLFC